MIAASKWPRSISASNVPVQTGTNVQTNPWKAAFEYGHGLWGQPRQRRAQGAQFQHTAQPAIGKHRWDKTVIVRNQLARFRHDFMRNGRQLGCPGRTVEQRKAQLGLQCAHLLTDSGVGDVNGFCRSAKCLVVRDRNQGCAAIVWSFHPHRLESRYFQLNG